MSEYIAKITQKYMKQYVAVYDMSKSISEKDKRRIIVTSTIFIVITLALTIMLVAKDLASSVAEQKVDLSSPSAMINSLQIAIDKESYVMLDKIFEENHYTSVFGELFFAKNVEVNMGFSDNPEIAQKKVLSIKERSRIIPGRIKYVTDDAATTFLLFDEVDDYPADEDNRIIRHLLNAAAVIQRMDGEWRITKLYDFMQTDVDFLEIQDFKLHHLENTLYIQLARPDYEDSIETTILYNFALQVENITVQTDDEILCNLGPQNMLVKNDYAEFELKNDSLHNPDKLIIEGKCDFSQIMSKNIGEKYLIYIILKTDSREYLLRYYGDLIL